MTEKPAGYRLSFDFCLSPLFRGKFPFKGGNCFFRHQDVSLTQVQFNFRSFVYDNHVGVSLVPAAHDALCYFDMSPMLMGANDLNESRFVQG